MKTTIEISTPLLRRAKKIALRDKIIVYVVDACPRPGAYGPRGSNEAMLPRTSFPQQVVALVGSIKQSLGSLATETGGVYLEAFTKSEMTKALSHLHEQLNSQYVVTYSPSGLQESFTRFKSGRPTAAFQFRPQRGIT